MNNFTYIFNFGWSVNNIGAQLTAYALQEVLKNFSYNSLVINNPRIHEKNCRFNKYIMFSKSIKNIFEAEKFCSKTETFITGSDQVFRPIYIKDKEYQYLLDFALPTSRKIAFSASFGVDKESFLEENSPEVIEHMKNSLRSFDFISVREKSGVEICKDVLGVEAEWVIDPVFILDRVKWDELIENATKDYSDRIISYVLDTNKEYKKAYKFLSKQNNAEVVELANSNESVENWLKAIRDCKFLITDSFHGMCFAIIFNKPFICLANKKRGATRFESILEMLNIENQCINSIDETYTKDCIFKVDYEKVNQRIEEERQKGLAFLQKALESPVGKFEEKQAVRTQYLEETVCKLEQQANLKYQIKKELWNLWLIIFHKYLPKTMKNLIRRIRGSK